MAKKNENSISYLQMPLPKGKRHYKMTKRTWNGLNYRQTVDSGALSMEKNISTLEAPYLVPSRKHAATADTDTAPYTNPIGLFGFDNILIVIYRIGSSIYVDYLDMQPDGTPTNRKYTGLLKSDATEADDYPRCVVLFNKYVESEDIVNGDYTKRILIFPDKKSMFANADDFLNDENNDTGFAFKLYDMDVTIREYTNDQAPYLPPASANHDYYYRNTHKCEETKYGTAVYKYCEYEVTGEDGGTVLEEGWKISVPPSFPNIKYATVHLSRLFGVSDDSVYASGFNDYANWNLDSLDAYNESNAWCTKAQSNTKAGGSFTGIINFQGHVVCFKKDFMHEIYNTKNPFRIQDVYAEGAIDHRTIQDVDGRLIFVSEDNVKIYTGSNPRIISYYLNISKYSYAVSGTDGRCYYLYCEDGGYKKRLFIYDTLTEYWSEQVISERVLNFACSRGSMYMLCKGSDGKGHIYMVNRGDYSDSWSFETDLITNNTVDIKHIKKIQMLAEIASNARLKVYILYDDDVFSNLSVSERAERLMYSIKASSGISGQKAIRVKPRKTASYGIKLHVEGSGYVKLYELELFMENGGDLYV